MSRARWRAAGCGLCCPGPCQAVTATLEQLRMKGVQLNRRASARRVYRARNQGLQRDAAVQHRRHTASWHSMLSVFPLCGVGEWPKRLGVGNGAGGKTGLRRWPA